MSMAEEQAAKMPEPDKQPEGAKKPSWFKRFWKSQGNVSFLSSLVSILIGLLIGLIVVLCINAKKAFPSYGSFLVYGFKSVDNVAQFLYLSAPYIMTGLAVAFCFKAGSFNIGGPGQYFVGGLCAYLSATMLKTPWYVSLLFAILGGALTGFIPGILKAAFNVNEVLSAIMVNWISLIFGNWILNSANLYSNGHTIAVTNVEGTNSQSIIPSWGLENFSNFFTIAIFIAIIIAVIVWVVAKKTAFGFELRSVGLNKDAAKYAGMKAKRTLVIAFSVAGALAGLGGAFYILLPSGANNGFSSTYTDLSAVAGTGFDGISVALLASNNPVGCIFSAIFISYIRFSSAGLSPAFNKNVGDIVIGIIVYFASFVMLIRTLIQNGFIKKGKKPGRFKAFFAKLFHKRQPALAAEGAAESVPAPSDDGAPAAAAPAEAGEAEGKKKACPWKKIGAGMKAFFSKVGAFFKKLWASFIGLFKKKGKEDAADKQDNAEDASDDEGGKEGK
jgi:simple sugar transport system permease protein